MIRNSNKLIKLYMGEGKIYFTFLILMFVLAFNDAKAQQNNSEMEQNDKVLIPASTNGKYGYIDVNGQWVIQPQYEAAQYFNNIGLARIKQNGQWGVIDQTGKIIITPAYPSTGMWPCIDLDEDGMIRVHKDGKMGLFDRNGRKIVELGQFTKIGKFCGYLYEHGNTVFYKNDVAPFQSAENELYGVMDRTGKIIVEPKYPIMDDYTKIGWARAELENHKCVFIDKTGKIMLEQPDVNYCGVFSYSSDFADIIKGDFKHGLIDKTGKIVVEPKFDAIEWHPFIFSDLAHVTLNDKYGSIDKTGKIVIEPQFETIYDFYPGEDLASVRKNGKYGFIDRTGKMVIEPKYEGAGNFYTNDWVAVRTHGKWGAIDKTGKMVIEPKYQGINIISNDYIILDLNKKESTLVNAKLEPILDSKYYFINLIPNTQDVFLTKTKIKKHKYEYGIFANGKHTVLKNVDFVESYFFNSTF